MENMACSEEYQSYRRELDAEWGTAQLEGEKTIRLSPNYRLYRKSYAKGNRMQMSENEVLNEAGETVYRYRTADDDGEFAKIIAHRDGEEYLIFRIDLYGYSVLRLSDKKEFHFIPGEACPQEESFIWTGVHYNPENDMLAVSGCYWACPFGVLLLDFSHPLKQTPWVDVQAQLEGGYDVYDDVDFVCWRGTSLQLQADNIKLGCRESVLVTQQEYKSWMEGEKVCAECMV